MTPERVIADWMEGAKCATHTAQTIADAKQLCADLHAAGFAIYDTRTHVAVPRRPPATVPLAELVIWRLRVDDMLSAASQEPTDGK